MPSPLADGGLAYYRIWSKSDIDKSKDPKVTLEEALTKYLKGKSSVGGSGKTDLLLKSSRIWPEWVQRQCLPSAVIAPATQAPGRRSWWSSGTDQSTRRPKFDEKKAFDLQGNSAISARARLERLPMRKRRRSLWKS